MNHLSAILSQKAEELFPDTATHLSEIQPPPPAAAAPTVSAVPEDTAAALKRMIYAMKQELDAMLLVLQGAPVEKIQISNELSDQAASGLERTLEGTFMGEKMLGDDGKEYPVPPNYASKSKLVAGDRLKLTITKSGSFIYKQVGPVERQRAIGVLAFDADLHQWLAETSEKRYRVLTASVTFYKGSIGDEVIILLPKTGEPLWGAVDNIIPK